MGSRGRGPLGLGEARAGGTPRVTLVDRGSSDRRRPAWLRRQGASAASHVLTCGPCPPCGVVGRPWVCPGPLFANVAAPAPGV